MNSSSTPIAANPRDRSQRLESLTEAAGALLANSLSASLGRTVRVLQSEVVSGDVAGAVRVVAPEDLPLLGVYVALDGDVSGRLVTCLAQDVAEELGGVLLAGLPTPPADRERLRQSALRELGNLAAGALANILNQFLQANVNVSVPVDVLDHAGVVISHAMLDQAGEGEDIVFLHVRLGGAADQPLCDLIFLPQPESVKWLLAAVEPPAWTRPTSDTDLVHVALASMASGQAPTSFKAILGSSVGVFLWDPETRIGGLSHVLLPGACLRAGAGKAAPTALPLLVDALAGLGADRSRLEAMIAGGGDVVPADALTKQPALGSSITWSVRETLDALAIPIVAEDCGGQRGRIFVAETATGCAYVSIFRGKTIQLCRPQPVAGGRT